VSTCVVIRKTREGRHLVLYLIVTLFCRDEFLELVFLLLSYFLKLLPLSLRKDRFYFFVGGADYFFEGVQFVLAGDDGIVPKGRQLAGLLL